MKILPAFFFILFISLSVSTFAQDFVIPASVPNTKEEFTSSEPEFIKTAKWLESTPVGTDMNNRTKANAYVLAWITNSPTVTIVLRSSVLDLFEKNPQLMMVYMGGFARYCLENNYSKDELQCNIAGIKSVINCYKLGGEIKKDKAVSKIIEVEKDGKLEDWVKKVLKEK